LPLDHADSLTWDSHGRCSYSVLKEAACEGVPGYSGGCSGRYTDDYGSSAWCSNCDGSGVVRFWKRIRVPEFDAPKPPKGWVPDWIEVKITS
jgi:hypothetical protein